MLRIALASSRGCPAKTADCNQARESGRGRRGEYERLRKLEHLKAPTFAELLLAMPTGGDEFERLEGRMHGPGF
jgi:hypothetical protein